MKGKKKQEYLKKVFMNFAYNFSQLSTCSRLKVGAVIVKDNRIISCGYNGTPSSFENCNDHFSEKEINSDNFSELHREFSKYEIHAEMNAILFAAKNGISCDGADLYTTISPCIDCAKAIIASKIKNVYYYKKYDRDDSPIEFLKKFGIEAKQVGIIENDKK